MSEFRLTMQEAPQHAYQMSTDDGAHWYSLTPARLTRVLESSCAYPDDARSRVDRGETVALRRNGRVHGYVRITPTAAQAAAAARQPSLF